MVGYCSTFFETIHYYFLTGDGSPFMAAIKWTSPVAAYITAIGWNMDNQLGKHIPALFIALFAAVALALLALELYRKRPSESAGKAMAFKWSMMPIRVLLVFAFGMGGAMFFWLLQSTIVWLVFGAVMGSLISHCVIEIDQILEQVFRQMEFQSGVTVASGPRFSLALHLTYRRACPWDEADGGRELYQLAQYIRDVYPDESRLGEQLSVNLQQQLEQRCTQKDKLFFTVFFRNIQVRSFVSRTRSLIDQTLCQAKMCKKMR